MAKIGNIDLLKKSEYFDSGAAFLLQKPSPISITLPIDDKTCIEIEKDNPYIVTRSKGLTNYQEAFDFGYELTQKSLDILSITGRSDLCVRDTFDENLVWWFSNNLITLRITDTGNSSFDTNIVINAGNAESNEPDYPNYSRAYRYFRLSQITTDLFDAYRNLYLAFESLASEYTPPNKGEKEKDWIKRYLKSIDKDILDTTFLGCTDPIQSFIDEIYKTIRCSLFHAKDRKNNFIPHGQIGDRQKVTEAMSKLTQIFLLVVKEKNSLVRGLGASMSTGLERAMLIDLFVNQSFFLISDDNSLFNPDETGFDHPRYKHAIRSENVKENASNTHKYSIIGNIKRNEFGDLSQIQRIELVNNKESLCTTLLEKPINIDGIDVLEIQLNQTIYSAKSVKQKFTT